MTTTVETAPPAISAAAEPGPVPQRQRIQALDVARGVAVLGILLMNIWAFGGPQAFFDYPVAIADRGGAPVATWAVMHTLFEGSQRALLSLLFGAGAMMILSRVDGSGGPAAARSIYYRRTFVLILFGLINAYVFLWPADILYVYGLAGLCLYPLRHVGTRKLMLVLLLALAIPVGLRGLEATRLGALESAAAQAMDVRNSGATLSAPQQQAITDWEKALSKARPSASDEEITKNVRTMQSGRFPEVVAHQAGASLILETIVAAKWWFLDALAGMIIGMALYRSGILTRPAPRGQYVALLATGFGVGLPLAAWQTRVLLTTDFHPMQAEIAMFGYDIRRLAMALGYLGLILLFCRTASAGAVKRWLAAVGRMALSNYLAQSILCAFIFYSFGLGLYGRLTGYQLYGVVLAIWALELVWSSWWLRHFQIGPFEWIWRSLTYRRAQAWRGQTGAVTLTWVAAVVLLSAVSAPLPAAELPLTKAESSLYTATSTHAEVMTFIRELQRRSSRVRVETLATSTEGREIPLLVIGDPAPASPSDLRYDQRAVVYFQANIHAGEVEGKEAALMLARDLTQGDAVKYLDRLVVLIAPIFNADGNDRISPANRTNQNGPAEGVGIRSNGQNLDLNRDGMKLETPEVRGLVQNVLMRWDPVFFLDAHTHNGSYHQEPVTWVWGLSPGGDPAIFDYMADTVWPAVERQMREQFGTLTIPHGDFLDVKNPAQGWVPLGPEPRYLSNYVGLRNRLAVLDEQYPYVDFKTRVQGAHSVMLTFLDFLHGHRDEVVALVARADRKTVGRGVNPAKSDVFIVKTSPTAVKRRLTIRGYEMEVKDTGSRYPEIHPTDVKRTYADVPYLARYVATRTVPLPRGYLIAAQDPLIIGKIREHGIAVERLIAPATVAVEAFSVTKLTGSGLSDQGHYNSVVEGAYARKDVSFPVGSYFVSMAQPLANVAAYLLEPESDDGLVFWNFFDRYVAFQWIPQPMEYPVYKMYERVGLITESLR